MLLHPDPAALVRWYLSADPATLARGREWYRSAAGTILGHVVAASGGFLSRERAAALVALLSPRKTWRENVRQALRAADAHYRGADPGAGPGLFRRLRPLVRAVFDPAADVASLFGPSAHKTRAFWRNLSGDLSAVTVDVWAARAAGAERADLGNPDQYDAVARAYRAAAEALGDAPASVQAVVWCRVRRAAGSLALQPSLPGMGLAMIA